MRSKSLAALLLAAVVVSLAGLAGCSAEVSALPEPTPTQRPASDATPLLVATPVPAADVVPDATPTPMSPPDAPVQPSPTRSPTPQAEAPIRYKDSRFGFRLTLPASWQGFTVVADWWTASAPGASEDQPPAAQGPQIVFRHPAWTPENPRQDIPIMVMTVEVWNALQEGRLHIGAAPMNPSELGRNSVYVFALPARYNYAFPEGFEEVEQILQGRPLQTFDPAG